MNLATNVAGLINSKPRKQDDQCKHFSSINKRGETKQRHKPHTVAEPHKTEETQSERPEPYNSRNMKGRS